MADKPVALVTGSTGRIGKEVVARLAQGGKFTVHAALHNPDKGEFLKKLGAHALVKFDYTDPATWDDALKGVSAVYSSSLDPLLEHHLKFSAYLGGLKGQIKHVVRVSCMGADTNTASYDKDTHVTRKGAVIPLMLQHYWWGEKSLIDAGVPLTVLRCNFFMNHLLKTDCENIDKEGWFSNPLGDTRNSFVCTNDIGEAAAVVLTDGPEKHANQFYDITGPEPQSMDEIAADLSKALKKTVTYRAQSFEQFEKDFGPTRAAFFEYLTNGFYTRCSPDFYNITKRKPTSYAEYLANKGTAGETGLEELYQANLWKKGQDAMKDAAKAAPGAPAGAAKRVLMVVTSHDKLGDTGKQTGWYLPEVAHPHFIFTEAGFELTYASPKGGAAPLDDGSVEASKDDAQSAKFLAEHKALTDGTKKLADVKPEDYDAVFFAGGYGTMWDFPDDADVQRVARGVWEKGGVVSAVCHGPAALVNVTLADGSLLVKGREVAAFTNEEEDKVGLRAVVPWTCEDKLTAQGAKYTKKGVFESHIAADGRLVTGQNPASPGPVATAVVALLTAPAEHVSGALKPAASEAIKAADAPPAAEAPSGPRTLIILGYGPAIGNSTARRFGKEGFQIACVSRTLEKVTKAAEELGKDGIKAKGYSCDVFDAGELQKLIAEVQKDLGPITSMLWNTFDFSGPKGSCSTPEQKSLVTCKPEDARIQMESYACYLVAMQTALPDLKAQKGSVLLTGGAFFMNDPKYSGMKIQFGMGTIFSSLATRRHACMILNEQLKDDGVYSGEVSVNGMVKRSQMDTPEQPAQVEPDDVAEAHWQNHSKREKWTVNVGPMPMDPQ